MRRKNYVRVLFNIILMCVLLAHNVYASEISSNKTQDQEYALYVNRALNTVTVYKVDENGEEVPYKSMICSCGRPGHNTPVGTFKTTDYYDWRLMVDGSWAQYAVRFNGMILFHSVPYHSKNPADLEWDQYNLLGQNVSLGCVRLAVKDVKWIYDNCKKGTKVVVYADDETSGPLGKPISRYIDPKSDNKGWDPTDDNTSNPWLKNKKKK